MVQCICILLSYINREKITHDSTEWKTEHLLTNRIGQCRVSGRYRCSSIWCAWVFVWRWCAVDAAVEPSLKPSDANAHSTDNTATKVSNSVPTGQGKLEKVREFEWSGKGHGKYIFSEKSGKMKNDATRCQICRLKCITFDFRWGSVPDPAGGAYSTPPDSVAALNIAP